MLLDGAKFSEYANKSAAARASAAFVEFLERRLGITALYDLRRIPYGRPDLAEPLLLARELLDRGIIDSYSNSDRMPDEPPIKMWACHLNVPGNNYPAGGSADDDRAALTAMIAEAIERYIWFTQRDYFRDPILATTIEIAARAYVDPARFAAFSEEQRERDKNLRFDPAARYLWIRGESIATGKKTWVPAQTVSAAHRPHSTSPQEPLIRSQITNGLATWPTQEGARLRGALECIERDAYMIMWYNQLTLPRARLSDLRKRSASLDTLVCRCEKYGLRVHVIPMLTDAPTHAACAILEDKSEIGPRFAFGLKASQSLARAAEGAIIEALRVRRFTRREDPAKHYDPAKPVDAIGHRGRTYYWWIPEHARHLERFVSGEEREFPEAAWEQDPIGKHLERIVAWCRERGYEPVSVPMGHSKANPTPWHVEMTIMPELQWMHVEENYRHLGGERLKSVPRQFGYEPRAKPFTEMPHTFC